MKTIKLLFASHQTAMRSINGTNDIFVMSDRQYRPEYAVVRRRDKWGGTRLAEIDRLIRSRRSGGQHIRRANCVVSGLCGGRDATSSIAREARALPGRQPSMVCGARNPQLFRRAYEQ
jgi:hypothetical protein